MPQSAAWAAVTNNNTATTARIATKPSGACVGNKANPSPRFDDAEAIQKIILPRNLTTDIKRGVLKARDLGLEKMFRSERPAGAISLRAGRPARAQRCPRSRGWAPRPPEAARSD